MVEFTLDTYIGSDVDDLMALAMILGSAEMHLRAVTTVYGDTCSGPGWCGGRTRSLGAPLRRSPPERGRRARDARLGGPATKEP